MEDNNDVHVVHNDPLWGVKVGLEEKARSHHYTRDAAKYAGRSIAMRMNADLVVHDIDGTVERRSYADAEAEPLG